MNDVTLVVEAEDEEEASKKAAAAENLLIRQSPPPCGPNMDSKPVDLEAAADLEPLDPIAFPPVGRLSKEVPDRW